MHGGGARAAGTARRRPGTTNATIVTDPRRINMVQAVNRVLEVELAPQLARRSFLGEDVGNKAVVFIR